MTPPGWLVRNSAPLGMAAAAYALAVQAPPGDPDTYWHIASGRWMLDHGALLREDIFSWTIRGQPYSVGEWLGQVVLAGAFQVGSWQGIVVLRALLVACGAFFLTRAARRAGAPWPAAIIVVLFALVLSQQSWGDRPQLFSIALLPVVLERCLAARAGETRALWPLPVILLLWTNLHGGYPLGIAVIGAFAAEAIVLRRPLARALVVTAVASLLATLLDPGALGIGAAASHVLSPPRFIVEEMPPDLSRPAGLLFAAFVVATLVGALVSRSRLLEVFLLVPLLWLALSAQRHLHWYAFASAPFIAAQAADLWRRVPYRHGRSYPLPAAAQVGLALALVAAAGASTAFSARVPDERAYPVGARDALRAGSGNLLHEYDWGGWLIFYEPGRPVFIDGRLFPFVPGVVDDYVELTTLGPRWRELLEQRSIREVLLRPRTPLVPALRDLGWVVAAEGTDHVMLRRR